MKQANRGFARYTIAVFVVVIVVGALFSLLFHGPGDHHAILVSAVVALAVQLLAAALGQVAGRGNLMARMGVGALLRLFSLVAYALIVALLSHIPAVAALISLATFFLLTSLIEPLLIKS